MNTLETVGWKKVWKFLWYGVYARFLGNTLPPVRVWMLRMAGARVGSDTVIFNVRWANLFHYGFSKVHIGSHCFIGDDVTLDTRGGIRLFDHVTLSSGCHIVTHINVGFPDHPLQKHYPTKEGRVVIQRGAYIGTAAIILPGITIGSESVVGAGAVVTKDVPAHAVVVGVPARTLRKL